MTDIKIHTTGEHQFTCVSNAFIDEYMQDANGEFVKFYLYLLRVLSHANGHLSISSMADKFQCTESDVRRGLSYWEKRELLQLQYDADGRITSICMLAPVNHSATETSVDTSTQVVKPAAVTPVPQEKTAPAPQPKEAPSYTPEDILSFQEEENVSELLMVSETYMGRPLSMTDMNTILFWYDGLHFSTELIEYLVEYCVEKGHGSIHYMNKVAQNWSEKGILSLEEAKQNTNIHSQSYYAVMKAFGISGRNLVPAETSYIEKWTNQYGFSLDIINEACNRTIRNIGKANFEYADSILTSWHEKGIRHLDDITSLDKSFAQSKSNKPAPKTNKTNNRFHNFQQRQYDDDFYVALEQQLLRK